MTTKLQDKNRHFPILETLALIGLAEVSILQRFRQHLGRIGHLTGAAAARWRFLSRIAAGKAPA